MQINRRHFMKHSLGAGARHFFVEHDRPEDAVAFMQESYQYLRANIAPGIAG